MFWLLYLLFLFPCNYFEYVWFKNIKAVIAYEGNNCIKKDKLESTVSRWFDNQENTFKLIDRVDCSVSEKECCQFVIRLQYCYRYFAGLFCVYTIV